MSHEHREPLNGLFCRRPTTEEGRLREALLTALSVALHEEADPLCTGHPDWFATKEVAERLVDEVLAAPVVQAALADKIWRAVLRPNA